MAQLALIEPSGPPRHVRPAPRALRPHYSRFVGLIKIILPAVAAALLGLIVVWPKLAPNRDRVPVGFTRADAAHVDALSIHNPRYYGTDEKNLPYTVTADVATQLDPTNSVVTLEKPVADLVRDDGKGIVVNSELGFLRQKDDTLDLLGKVDLYRDDGYEMHTESARVHIAKGDVEGDQPVQGQGATGTVEGEGFTMTDRGRTIVFTGHSHAELNVGQGKAAP